MYRHQGHLYQIHLILGSLCVHPSPYLLPQKYLPIFFYKLVYRVLFNRSFVFITCHIFQNGYSCCPLKHCILVKSGLFLKFSSSSTLLTTSSSMGNYTQSSLWISLPVYSDMNNFSPYSFCSLKAIMGMLLLFNVCCCAYVYHGIGSKENTFHVKIGTWITQ